MAIRRKPDFIIAGAMKSGTTWLHDALNELPGIHIPREEVHWIDAMDPTVHPDFQHVDGRGLHLATVEESSWDLSCENDDNPDGVLGYDSSTLFHSKIDLARAAKLLPETKILVVLRDPVDRAYSHYWHLVRTGRARYRFERELLDGKREILDRSIYVDQVRRFQRAFDSRVHFVCYERMFAEPEVVLAELLQFLDLPAGQLPNLVSRVNVRSNPGRYPRFLGGWLLGSRLLAGLERGRYAHHVGKDRQTFSATIRYGAYVAKLWIMAALAAGVVRRTPPMKATTRHSLCLFLRQANSELDANLAGSWSQWWYRSK